ncbi:MAG: alpha/beta hydrolase, partial [Thermoanaerobaculia bacterium]
MDRLVDRLIGPRVLLADAIHYARPEEFGLSAREVEVPAPRGLKLSGLWMDGPPEAPAVLFLPGNSANLSGHLPYLEVLGRAGVRALGLDYSGFGRSGGRPSLRGLIGDAEAGLEALKRLAGPAAPLGVFGVSLGAGLGMELAARRREIGAVAAEGLSIQREAVRGLLQEGCMGPRWVRSVRDQGGPAEPRPRHRLARSGAWSRGSLIPRSLSRLAEATYPFAGKDPRRAAGRLGRRPVFIAHGARDALLPFEAALLVHRALAGPRRLWIIPEAGHAQEPAILCGEEYALQLEDFFRQAFSARPPAAAEVEWRAERSGDRCRATIEL